MSYPTHLSRKRIGWPLFLTLTLLAFCALSLAPSRSDAYIYWTNGDAVGRASLNGSNVNNSFIGVGTPSSLAITDQHIYWGNLGSESGSIGRANLDGSAANNFFLNVFNPWGIAAGNGNIYWASLNGNAIARASLSAPFSLDQGLITGANKPYSAEVSATHLYWANSGDSDDNSFTLGRANLNGTGVNQSFITGANDPRGIAVGGGHIYWTNFGSNSIGRADLDGTNSNPNFITGASKPNDVAVDGEYIYWANFGSNSIGRANLNGSGVNQNFISLTAAPSAIAVGPDTEPPTLTLDSGPEGATSNASPTFGFTAGVGTVTCSIDTGTPGFGPCTSSSTHSPPAPLADGNFTFRVRAVDELGNAITLTRNFTVDTVAPDTTIDLGPPEQGDNPNASFFFSTPDPAAVFQCRLDDAAFAACVSPMDYNGLSDGSHTFEVRALDTAGNADPSPASRTFVVDTSPPDTTAPLLTVTTRPKARIVTRAASTVVRAAFRSESGATFTCSFDGARFKACSSPYSVRARSAAGKGRRHTIRIQALDGAGNRSAVATFTFRVIRKR